MSEREGSLYSEGKSPVYGDGKGPVYGDGKGGRTGPVGLGGAPKIWEVNKFEQVQVVVTLGPPPPCGQTE